MGEEISMEEQNDPSKHLALQIFDRLEPLLQIEDTSTVSKALLYVAWAIVQEGACLSFEDARVLLSRQVDLLNVDADPQWDGHARGKSAH